MFGGDSGLGCRRCSNCSIHYPTDSRHQVCEVCDEPTSFFSNVAPDPEWEDAVKYAKMHPPGRIGNDPENYRFERYLKMGFDQFDAQVLSLAVYGQPAFPLYWGLVKQALDSGVTHAVAFEVFS